MLYCIDIAVSQPAAMKENALYGLTDGQTLSMEEVI